MEWIDKLINDNGGWLNCKGPKSNIVISSRIRVARNLEGYPFFNWAKEDEKKKVLEKLMSTLKKCDYIKDAVFARIRDLRGWLSVTWR